MQPLRPRNARTAAVLVLLCAVLAGLALAGPASAAGRRPTPPPPATPPVSPAFGISMPTIPGDLTPLRTLSTQLGRTPGRVMYYAAWGLNAGFDANAAGRVAALGALPVITWEPWDYTRGVDQPTYSLARIAAGAHDSYLSRWARGIKGYGGPVVLRFAHEMNGGWYPWGGSVNGNSPADYVAAWRHVVDVFRAQRVTNVTWDWSPNVPFPGSVPLAELYPGDEYVDQVSLDGYNWGGHLPGTSWISFDQVFVTGIEQVRALAPGKPLFIGEVGAPESSVESKAAWITDMFTTLDARTEIAGFTWFSHQKEQDWRIDSSPASLEAFRAGLAGYDVTTTG